MNSFVKKITRVLCVVGLLGSQTSAFADPPDIWGAKFIVGAATMNAAGFISFLKVVNPTDDDTEVAVNADILYALADGTEGVVSGTQLGIVDANGILPISEASIIDAIGNPTQVVFISMVLYIQNPDAIVVAEKRATDGRVRIPVEKVFLLTDPSAS